MSEKKKMLSVSQIAAYFNINKRTIYRWIAEGRVSIIRLPSGRIRIDPDDLAKAMQNAYDEALKRKVRPEVKKQE